MFEKSEFHASRKRGQVINNIPRCSSVEDGDDLYDNISVRPNSLLIYLVAQEQSGQLQRYAPVYRLQCTIYTRRARVTFGKCLNL